MKNNPIKIVIPTDLAEQFQHEAKSGNFNSTEAYILHLLEQERLKEEPEKQDYHKGEKE